MAGSTSCQPILASIPGCHDARRVGVARCYQLDDAAPESCWGAFFVRADGVTTGRLPRNRAGVLISEVDTSEDLYDSTQQWREHALAGVLNSGSLVSDERSANRHDLSRAR